MAIISAASHPIIKQTMKNEKTNIHGKSKALMYVFNCSLVEKRAEIAPKTTGNMKTGDIWTSSWKSDSKMMEKKLYREPAASPMSNVLSLEFFIFLFLRDLLCGVKRRVTQSVA